MEIKTKSVIPVYGFAVVWVSYCLFFPLFRTWHFVILACAAVLSYVILSVIFPGTAQYVEVLEEPARTGDHMIDALLEEGEKAVREMRVLCDSIPGDKLKKKITDIILVVDKIFKNLHDDKNDYKQVKRFADYYLPTTIKLLHTYDRLGSKNIQGENVTGMLEQIDAALDMILESYIKFFDSLFENQVMDIETDIVVLENMLKKEGLLNSDF